jgi:hypothetical protein
LKKPGKRSSEADWKKKSWERQTAGIIGLRDEKNIGEWNDGVLE